MLPAWGGAVPTVQPVLVQSIATSAFAPPSPDPAGITPIANGNLLISDSEVNEMPPYYQGFNLFEIAPDGTPPDWESVASTAAFSNEPTGVSFDPTTGHYFFSDDDRREVTELDPGPDGVIGTGDDAWSTIETDAFGCDDPEDVAFDPVHELLYIVDGAGRRICILDPGPNGVFDGVPAAGGDDIASSFLTNFGANDPEGIAYDAANDVLLIVDRSSRDVYETEPDGTLLRIFDTSVAMNAISVPTGSSPNPSGGTLAPGSTGPSAMNLWIVDRRRDNNQDPNENDGLLYEFFLGPAPTLGSFAPSQGSEGSFVTLAGSGFLGTTEVSFGGVSATLFHVVSDVELNVAVPAGAVNGLIRVTNPAGFADSATPFDVTRLPGVPALSPVGRTFVVLLLPLVLAWHQRRTRGRA